MLAIIDQKVVDKILVQLLKAAYQAPLTHLVKVQKAQVRLELRPHESFVYLLT